MVAAGAWVALAVVVAVFVGRAVSQRDRQVPRPDPADQTVGSEPGEGSALRRILRVLPRNPSP